MLKFKKYGQKLNTEEGATLVELLAAIAILAVIVTSFLGFFVQAGNTNNRTDKVNEATLLAQGEMEKITYLLQHNSGLDQVWSHYINNDYKFKKKANDIELSIIEKYHKEIIITKPSNGEDNEVENVLHNITVEISEGGAPLAKMETWIPIEKADLQDNSE